MKHLLNDLTEKEKNSIREQHTGGMKVVTENFSKLINTKSGNVKPLVNEQGEEEFLDREFKDRMKKVIRLTENDLARIVRRVIKENEGDECENLMGEMENIFNESMSTVKSIKGEGKNIDGYDALKELRNIFGEIMDVAFDKDCSNIMELEQIKLKYLYLMGVELGEIEPYK